MVCRYRKGCPLYCKKAFICQKQEPKENGEYYCGHARTLDLQARVIQRKKEIKEYKREFKGSEM